MNNERVWLRDGMAVLVLLIAAAAIMRGHLAGQNLFLGNYDRLGYFLSSRLQELDALKSRGETSDWNDTLFMGFNSADLPGASSALSPMRLVTALSSRQEFFFWAGVCVTALMALAGISAYACLRKLDLGIWASGMGAMLYMCSTHSMIRLAQSDTSSLLLAALPTGTWMIFRARPDNAGWHLVGVTALSALVFFSSTGAPTIYLMGFWVFLAAFQWWKTRTVSALLVVMIGVALGGMIALPHLWGVASELRGFVRDGGVGPAFEEVYAFFNVLPREFLRIFDEGIFGRYPDEVAAFGNNLNLNEGYQVYSSTFATLAVCSILLRFRGEWLRLFKFRDGVFSLFAWVLILVSAAILIKPAAEVMFVLFLKGKLIHARLSFIATLAMAALAALFVHESLAVSGPARRPWIPILTVLLSGATVLCLQWVGNGMHSPAKLDLNRPLLENAATGIRLLTGSAEPWRAPTRVEAVRIQPRLIRLSWEHAGRPADRYEIVMGRDGAPLTLIGTTSGYTYDVGDIDPTAVYTFSIGATASALPTAASAPVNARLYESGYARTWQAELAERGIRAPVWIHTGRLLSVAGSLGIFLLLSACSVASNRRQRWPVQALLALSIFQAWSEASFRWNGEQNRTFPRPFANDNIFVAPNTVLRSANPPASASVQAQLEPARFRTVFIPASGQFSHFVAPPLASYWGIRTVEGYLSGVPRRLAALRWPAGQVGFRSIMFASADALPWDLLGALNVRQAVVVDTPLFFDLPRAQSEAPGASTGEVTSGLQVITNPSPVLPREFFAARTIPAEPFNKLPPGSIALSATDVLAASSVEGLAEPQTWRASGSIKAHYAGDHITVEVTPADDPRFLVLNDLYHPRWSARAGSKELRIYPVNTVMRGVIVPAGASSVQFEFHPYSRFQGWWLFPTAGIALAWLGMNLLGRRSPGIGPSQVQPPA